MQSDLPPPAVAFALSSLSDLASELSTASLDDGYSASPPAPYYEGGGGDAGPAASLSEESGANRWWYSLEGTQVGVNT